MQVDDPASFLKDKVANLCTHVEAHYPAAAEHTPQLRALPATVLVVLVRRHLLPHRELIEAGELASLAGVIDDEAMHTIALACAEDTKVQRYLQLFCELCC